MNYVRAITIKAEYKILLNNNIINMTASCNFKSDKRDETELKINNFIEYIKNLSFGDPNIELSIAY